MASNASVPAIFDQPVAQDIRPGHFRSSSDDTVVYSTGYNNCTGLLIVAKNHQGETESTLFHITPERFGENIESKLKAIARYPGQKAGVFITTQQSTGDRRDDTKAAYFSGLLRTLVKDITLAPAIECPHTGMSLAYSPADGTLHVWNHGTKQVTTHTPFNAGVMQSLVIGGREKK